MFKKKEKKIEEKNTGVLDFSYKKSEDEDNLVLRNIKKAENEIYPNTIDILESPEYIIIDGTYISVFPLIDFPYKPSNAHLDSLVNFCEGVEFYIEHNFCDKQKAITDITSYLGYTLYKMNQGENQKDSAIQENAKNSSMYMKRMLSQGDELFFIHAYIKISSDNKENFFEKLRRIEAELVSKGIKYKRASYKQLEAFLKMLPINFDDKNLDEITEKNMLTSGLASLYPFTASSLSDPEGMFLGINEHDQSQIIIDNFNTEKYPNANMVIMGKSGIGKSFLTQMLISRYRMQRIPIMIICPLKGHEYRPLCENLGGNYFKFAPGEENGINILDIKPIKILGEERASYLASKLQRLRVLYSLMIKNITDDEMDFLEEATKRAYQKYDITFENESLYINENKDKNFVNLMPKLKEMPILSDVYEESLKIPELKRISKKLEKYVTGSLSFLNKRTNIDMDNLYTVCDISEITEELVPFTMLALTEIFWDKIKENRMKKKILIIDELWKLIGNSANSKVAETVLEYFKIVRGYAGAIVGTTQDINDFFALEEGKYGKGIINAASIKIVLGLESIDAAMAKEKIRLSEEEYMKIMKFKRGEGLIIAGQNHVTAKFTAFKEEERLINTDRKKLLENNSKF